MSKRPKMPTDPLVVRSLIYKVLLKKPEFEGYQKLSKDGVSFAKLNKMYKTHGLPTDPVSVRSFIMYEFLLEIPIFEGYQKLCTAIGDDVVSFPEYEYWYYRFYGGNLDVNYDRSADLKPLTFDDLPLEMVEEIVGKLELKSRLTTRKVCKKLLETKSQMSRKVERIIVELQNKYLKLMFNNENVSYAMHCDGCTVKRRGLKVKKISDYYLTRAMEDLKIVLEIPKVEIQRFTINIGTYARAEELLQCLYRIGGVAHVEEARCQAARSEIVLSMLELFKPEALKKIDLRIINGEAARNISGLLAMDHFKKAKEIDLDPFAIIESCLISNHFQHFASFCICVNTMSTDQIVHLRDMLIGSAHFQECTILIYTKLTPADLQAIRRALGVQGDNDDREIQYQHMVPNSDGAYLEFKIFRGEICVTKKSPEAYGARRFFRNGESSSSFSSDSDSD